MRLDRQDLADPIFAAEPAEAGQMRAISFGNEKNKSSAPTKTTPPTIIIIIERERAR